MVLPITDNTMNVELCWSW